MIKSILCTECEKQIRSKKELVVAGKLMQPYHKNCLEKPNSRIGKLHRFSGTFPVGIRFWFLVILGNLFFNEMLSRNPQSLTVIVVSGMLFNVIFIGGRIAVYLTYEKYLE